MKIRRQISSGWIKRSAIRNQGGLKITNIGSFAWVSAKEL